jgi:hypothetical protein
MECPSHKEGKLGTSQYSKECKGPISYTVVLGWLGSKCLIIVIFLSFLAVKIIFFSILGTVLSNEASVLEGFFFQIFCMACKNFSEFLEISKTINLCITSLGTRVIDICNFVMCNGNPFPK